MLSLQEGAGFLQPADPGALKWTQVATPDALDLLITSRNYDLKREIAAEAEAQDWLFALISLQVSEGYGGRGNHGIARMNGGSSSGAMVARVPMSAASGESSARIWGICPVFNGVSPFVSALTRRRRLPLVLDEGCHGRNAVIEFAGRFVEILRHPINARGSIGICCLIDRFDQRAARARAARLRIDIEILEVAHVFDAPVVGVIDHVDQADHLAAGLSDKGALLRPHRIQ